MDAGSAVGWIDLSPAALRRLRQELAQEEQGVVDEMGVQAIHAGYANRFFPGTSVLQKRPRYAFFSCWNYLCLDDLEGGGSAISRKEASEDWVRKHLLASGQKNVIGARVERPAQPPDFVYWTALRRWGLYRGPDRSMLLSNWKSFQIRRVGERASIPEEDNLERIAWFKAPRPPSFWLGKRPRQELTFDLTRGEAEFLLERLETLPRCVLSLAAVGARKTRPRGVAIWTDPVVRAAASAVGDSEPLERARYASALSLFVRATYGALVERRRNETIAKWEREQLANPDHYRMTLTERLTGPDLDKALKADVDRILADLSTVPESNGASSLPVGQNVKLRCLLENTHEALARNRRPADVVRHLLRDEMLTLYEDVERSRKGNRARLPDTAKGQERRRTFDDRSVTVAGIDYRWGPVKMLLQDLHEGLNA